MRRTKGIEVYEGSLPGQVTSHVVEQADRTHRTLVSQNRLSITVEQSLTGAFLHQFSQSLRCRTCHHPSRVKATCRALKRTPKASSCTHHTMWPYGSLLAGLLACEDGSAMPPPHPN